MEKQNGLNQGGARRDRTFWAEFIQLLNTGVGQKVTWSTTICNDIPSLSVVNFLGVAFSWGRDVIYASFVPNRNDVDVNCTCNQAHVCEKIT